jgi:hypothetical protein
MDFRTRLNEEYAQLGEKLEKLNAFLQGEHLAGLPPAQQDLLKKQVIHMTDYYNVLKERIDLLEKDASVSSTFGNEQAQDASIGKHDPSLSNSPGPKDQSAGLSSEVKDGGDQAKG